MSSRSYKPSSPTRPSMPSGYGIKPPDQGRLLQWPSIETKLTDAHNYWLVTASPDGKPHAAPLWGLWHVGSFYFSTDPASRKGDNLTRNDSVVVHLESGDDVVILEGIAHRVTDESLLDQLDRTYHRKYGFPLRGNPVYQVEVATAFAWAESDFPESATRWRFDTADPSADA